MRDEVNLSSLKQKRWGSLRSLRARVHGSPPPSERKVLNEFREGVGVLCKSEESARLAQLSYEKCDLASAQAYYQQGLQEAQNERQWNTAAECLVGLVRCASDQAQPELLQKWEQELERLYATEPDSRVAMVFFCRAVLARRKGSFREARREMHRYLLHCEEDMKDPDQALAKGWVFLATLFWQMGRLKRAEVISEFILKLEELGGTKKWRALPGLAALNLGLISEAQGNWVRSRSYFQKSHLLLLAEHHWYYHLYVLLAYGRLDRKEGKFESSRFHLELVRSASNSSGFELLHQQTLKELKALEELEFDLVIDVHHSRVRVPNLGWVDFRKQHTLLRILQLLGLCHQAQSQSQQRSHGPGVSKQELIEVLWGESYHPGQHDTRIYYNLNRLRRLIEADPSAPQLILHSPQGYRFPGDLKVQMLGVDQELIQKWRLWIQIEKQSTGSFSESWTPGLSIQLKDREQKIESHEFKKTERKKEVRKNEAR